MHHFQVAPIEYVGVTRPTSATAMTCWATEVAVGERLG